MNLKKYDIAIIGGGPAGSSAAILLSKKGYSVTIIEKKSFPREVLCGEFISKEVVEFLIENSLYEEFLKLNPNPISSFRFSGENGKDLFASLKFPAYGIKRSKLDNFLLSKARENGTEIFQPVEAKEIQKQTERYLIKIKSGVGEEFTLYPKIIIAAYGKQNILDKNFGRDFYRIKSKLNGVKFHIDKTHFNSFNSEEIQVYTGHNIYCGINAVDNNTITLCFLEKRDKSQYSPKELLLRLSQQNKKFNALFNQNFFDCIDKFQVYGTGNIYFGKRDIVNEGIFYIGDSAGVIAPLVGDGIGIAVQSARLVSDILCRNNLVQEKAGKEYEKEWRNKFLRRMLLAGIIQKIVLNNSLRNPGIRMISFFPGVLSTIIKYTRE
jgi:flavin-dependent dehydrogenase